MDLDEHVEPESLRLRVERGQPARVQRRDDQQDRVGAARQGFDHLIVVDDEVLAQDRQRRRAPRAEEIVKRPPKPSGSVRIDSAAAPARS